jgi:hypothetical protein
VPTLSAVQEATAITDLDMYPNPAASQLFLEWEVDDASFQVQGAVYNTLGQHVLRFYPEKTGTARQYAVLSLQDWPEGMYWLHLQGGKETLVRKFMVQR